LAPRSTLSQQMKPKVRLPYLLGTLLLLLGACSPQTASPPLSESTATNPPPTPTILPPIATNSLNPPAPISPLPAEFTTNSLRAGNSPVNYIQDSCQYMANRWDPENSLPGTVVAPIMFHSIRPYGEEVSDPSSINLDYFDATIRFAENLGFETITSEELTAFLEENAKIPSRSMLLILDDRRPGTAEEYFLPVLKANDWTATLSWPIGDTDSRTGLWEWIERLNETSYFDIQSHGLNHIYLTDSTPKNQLREEIFGSIPILEDHFGTPPIAYIWPGGNYTALAVELAQEAGFRLGFTIHSRGPIMFNWVPQGEKEQAIGEPQMLLPRFWSSAALLNLDQAAAIGDEARLFANENYPAEAAWYRENCGAELANLSDIFKED